MPVGQVAGLVVEALDAGAPVVTDVGSVKAPDPREVEAARPDLAARFVGGHPMAGSEQDGLDGADADLFVGATWVLTPTDRTDPDALHRGAEPRRRSRRRSIEVDARACTTRSSRW